MEIWLLVFSIKSIPQSLITSQITNHRFTGSFFRFRLCIRTGFVANTVRYYRTGSSLWLTTISLRVTIQVHVPVVVCSRAIASLFLGISKTFPHLLLLYTNRTMSHVMYYNPNRRRTDQGLQRKVHMLFFYSN